MEPPGEFRAFYKVVERFVVLGLAFLYLCGHLFSRTLGGAGIRVSGHGDFVGGIYGNGSGHGSPHDCLHPISGMAENLRRAQARHT